MGYFDKKYLTVPDKDHLEITVFGPSYRESIILHIPTIGWGVIDSCEFNVGATSINLPLEYLDGVLSEDTSEIAFVTVKIQVNRFS